MFADYKCVMKPICSDKADFMLQKIQAHVLWKVKLIVANN